MKLSLLLIFTLFSIIAFGNSTAVELARGFNAVTDWAVEQGIRLDDISSTDEHYYDGDLDTLEFVIRFDKKEKGKVLHCEQHLSVDYPYIPKGKIYDDVDKAFVDAAIDAECK